MCNISKIFDHYRITNSLNQADIFHLYESGVKHADSESGYHDSRHFKLMAFNTRTQEKCDLGVHDGIQNLTDDKVVDMIRIFADGSTIVRFRDPVKVEHCIPCAADR